MTAGSTYKERSLRSKKFFYESGLYYEKLGELYQESLWKLVINIDIGLVNKRIHTLQNYIDHAHHLCKIQTEEGETYENTKKLIEK